MIQLYHGIILTSTSCTWTCLYNTSASGEWVMGQDLCHIRYQLSNLNDGNSHDFITTRIFLWWCRSRKPTKEAVKTDGYTFMHIPDDIRYKKTNSQEKLELWFYIVSEYTFLIAYVVKETMPKFSSLNSDNDDDVAEVVTSHSIALSTKDPRVTSK